MYAQCDVDGHEYLLLESFIDHRKNDLALSVVDWKVVLKGRDNFRKSTAGWDICCKLKDDSTSQEKLSSLKDLYTIKVVEYVIAQIIHNEPDFNWWVHHVLKKQNRIISSVKRHSAIYLKRIQKFGTELPKIVKEAVAIYEKNENTL